MAAYLTQSSASQSLFSVGDKVSYLSRSMNQWIPCTIIYVNEDGEVQISIKPGHWMSLEEQQERMRILVEDPKAEDTAPQVFAPPQRVAPVSERAASELKSARSRMQGALDESLRSQSFPSVIDQAQREVCHAVCPLSHRLEFAGSQDVGWCCAASREVCGCLQRIKEPVKSPGQVRFRCAAGCDFSLCGQCAQRKSLVPRADTLIEENGAAVLETKASSHSASDPGSPQAGPSPEEKEAERETSLGSLPKEVWQVNHNHQLKLKTTDDRNSFNVIKRLGGGNTCSVPHCKSPNGHFNYYKCFMPGCKFYCCLECAKHATPIEASKDGSGEESGRKSLENLTPVQKAFYTQLQSLLNADQVSQFSERELYADVLSVSELKDSSYRFGDFTGSAFRWISGSERIFYPYVRVTLGDMEGDTTVTMTSAARAEFDLRLYFPVPASVRASRSLKGHQFQVTVFDSRGFIVAGDPIIGEATLELEDTDLYEDREITLTLTRGGTDDKGSIAFKVGTCEVEVATAATTGKKEQTVTAENVFERYDVKKEKRLDRNGMRNVVNFIYANLALEAPDEAFIDTVFSRADHVKDGFIDWDDFPNIFRWICTRSVAALQTMGADDLRPKAKGYFAAKYLRGKRLAAGVGGTTYIATQRASGTKVVVKQPMEVSAIEDFELLKDKFHPNIVRVFELFTSERETFVVMEFCGGGDLFGTMQHCYDKFGGATYKFIASMMKQSMQGVNYLAQEFRQCHNDLKPENVLLESRPLSLDEIPRCMIADFGCVGKVDDFKEGDPRYRAPELWAFKKGEPPAQLPSFASDVWSLGVMFFEMLSGGNLPFIQHRNLSSWPVFFSYEKGKLLRILFKAMQTYGTKPDWSEIEKAGDLALDLCKGMLAWDRRARPSLQLAMQHPYFDVLTTASGKLPENLSSILRKRSQLTTLKICLLNFVASKLQGKHLRRYADMWDKFDRAQEGILRPEPFIQTLTEELGFTRREANDILNLTDVWGDDTAIDFNEFVALTFDPTAFEDGEYELFLKGVFDTVADEDGKIDFKDFAEVFPNSQAKPVIQTLFMEIDAYKAGWISWNDFKYFVEAM